MNRGLARGLPREFPNFRGLSIGGPNPGQGLSTISIGENQAAQPGGGNIIIGDSASAIGTNNISIGNNATSAGATNSTSLGTSAQATGTTSCAFGASSSATGSQGVAVGASSVAATAGVAVGYGAQVAANAVAIGDGAGCTVASAIAIGVTAGASGTSAIAIGSTASATATSSIAIGPNSSATGGWSIALGYQAHTGTGGDSVVIGAYAMESITTGIVTALGYAAGFNPNGQSSWATTTGTGQTLIGYQTGQASSTQVNYITCLGWNVTVGAIGSTAIGADSLGHSATTSVQDQAVIGTVLTQTKVQGLATQLSIQSLAYSMLRADHSVLVYSDVSTADSSANAQTLVLSGQIGTIASPGGASYGQAAQFLSGGYMNGPTGIATAGAVSGTAFTLDVSYTASPSEVGTGSTFILSRLEATSTQYQWHLHLVAGGYIQLSWFNSAGTLTTIQSAAGYIVAGVRHQYEVCWNGASIYLFVDGVQVGNAAMTSVYAATSTGYLQIGNGTSSTGAMEELRFLNTCANTAAFTAYSAPFTTTPTPAALYHFAGGTTLPSPASAGLGARYTIKSIGIPFCIRPHAGEVIDGGGNNPIYGFAYGAWTLVTDGSNWYTEGYRFPPWTNKIYTSGPVALSAGVANNITSLSLPAGAFMVTCMANCEQTSAGNVDIWLSNISSGGGSSAAIAGANGQAAAGGTADLSFTVPVVVYATTTFYLNVESSGAGTVYAVGSYSTAHITGIVATRTQ